MTGASDDPSTATLAERIAHERALREMASAYETQLRAKSDEYEKETRETITDLGNRSLQREWARLEERLEVLNNERARQEADRGTFATKTEVDLSFAALADKTTASVLRIEQAIIALTKTLTTDVAGLREANIERTGQREGKSSITDWLAPNLGAVIAIILSAVTLVILLNGPRVTL